MSIRAIIAVSLFAMSLCGTVSGQHARLDAILTGDDTTGRSLLRDPAQTAPTPAPRRADNPVDPLNPGFQQVDGDGLPEGWDVFGQPKVFEETGNRYLRVNNSNYVRQTLAPAAEGRYRTVTFRGRGQLGFERALVGMPLLSDDDLSYFPYTRVSVPNEEWQRVFVTNAILPERTAIWLQLQGVDRLNWIDVDDVVLFDDGLRNGSFEDAYNPAQPGQWNLTGAAGRISDRTLDSSGALALLLPPGTRASQLASALDDGQVHFLAGKARSAMGTGSLRVGETWLSGTGDTVGETSTTLSVETAGTAFSWETGNSPGTAVSETFFLNESDDDLILDRLSRGWTRVFPEVYFPGQESANPLLTFSAAWPREVQSATVRILNEQGFEVGSVPLTVADGHVVGEWDGAGVPTGNYEAVFEMQGRAGVSLSFSRPFGIRENLGFEEPAALQYDGIPRGAWIWLYADGNSVEELRPVFETAKQDGFSFAIVFGRTEQWAAVREACEQAEMPFMLGEARLNSMIKRVPTFDNFNRAEFVDTVNETIGEHFESSFCIGFYVVDEPGLPYEVEWTAKAFRIAGTEPGWKTPFSVNGAYPNLNEFQRTVSAPVYTSDFYPVEIVTGGNEEAALRRLGNHVLEQTTLATQDGRDYWCVNQSYSDGLFARMGGANLTRATIGVTFASGSKGHIPFFYRQITVLEGIRTKELAELPTTPVWREENLRLGQYGAALRPIQGHALFENATGPLWATTAMDLPTSRQVVYLVSLDVETPLEASMRFEIETVLTPLAGGETLQTNRDGDVTVTLDPGQWFAWRVEQGALQSASGVPVSTPPSADLPVLVDVPALGGPIFDIEFNADGSQILATGRDEWVLLDSSGTEISRAPLQRGFRGQFATAGRVAIADEGLGYRIFDNAGNELDGFTYRAGSAQQLLAGAQESWAGMAYLGIRRLVGAESPESAGIAFSTGLSTTIHPAPASEGVLYLDNDDALMRVVPDGDGVTQVALTPGSRLWRGALSPEGYRLAVCRMRRPVIVYNFGSSGELQGARELSTPVSFAEDVDWIDGARLAVGGMNAEVAFLSAIDGTELAHWRAADRTETLMAIDVHENELAVAFGSGRVIVLDCSSLAGSFPGTVWTVD